MEAPRLPDRVRHTLRIKHYSLRTEQAYVQWIRRFIRFHAKCHPRDMGAAEITAFFNDLTVHRKVSASTQNQALSALLFLHKEVLRTDLAWLDDIERAKWPQRVAVALTKPQVDAVLNNLRGWYWPDGQPVVWGIRVTECVRLRVKDVDFGYRQVTVRDDKGQKARVTILPMG